MPADDIAFHLEPENVPAPYTKSNWTKVTELNRAMVLAYMDKVQKTCFVNYDLLSVTGHVVAVWPAIGSPAEIGIEGTPLSSLPHFRYKRVTELPMVLPSIRVGKSRSKEDELSDRAVPVHFSKVVCFDETTRVSYSEVPPGR